MAKEQLASQQFAYNLGSTGTVERSGNKIKMLTKKNKFI